MYHTKMLLLFFVIYSLYSIGDCRSIRSKSARHRIAPTTNGGSKLDCSQFANDNDILLQLPFYVEMNETIYEGFEVTGARMDEDNNFVEHLIIKEEAYVPLSVFCLSKLTFLYIESTPFENDIIPDEVENLKSLKHWAMFFMPIKHVSEKLTTLVKLQTLSFFNCSLTDLPDLHNLPNLKTLDLAFNKFQRIDQFLDLNLQGIDLTGNNLTQIPILKNKDKLLDLSVGSNPLKDIESITLYPNLRSLDLSESMLTSIPSTIDQLQQLEYLLIHKNQLTQLPSSIYNLPKLEFISGTENLFSSQYIQEIEANFQKYQPSTLLNF